MLREDLIGFRKSKSRNLSLLGWSPIFSVKKYSKTLKNLDDVVWESLEELPTYRDILEILDRVKKSQPKTTLEEKQDYPKSVTTFTKKNEALLGMYI